MQQIDKTKETLTQFRQYKIKVTTSQNSHQHPEPKRQQIHHETLINHQDVFKIFKC
jgi:hypothetical protein